jgi:hypothetical protein
VFLVISECSIFKSYFARNWPLLSPTHSFNFLGFAMVILGNNILGNLNKEATSQKSLGLPFWRVVIGAGIIVFALGFVNIAVASKLILLLENFELTTFRATYSVTHVWASQPARFAPKVPWPFPTAKRKLRASTESPAPSSHLSLHQIMLRPAITPPRLCESRPSKPLCEMLATRYCRHIDRKFHHTRDHHLLRWSTQAPQSRAPQSHQSSFPRRPRMRVETSHRVHKE